MPLHNEGSTQIPFADAVGSLAATRILCSAACRQAYDRHSDIATASKLAGLPWPCHCPLSVPGLTRDACHVYEQISKEIHQVISLAEDSALPVQMTIMYSNPVICAVLGWAFRAEKVGFLGALGIMVTLLGVVSVAQPPVIFGGHEWSHRRMAGGQRCSSTTLSLTMYRSFHACNARVITCISRISC